MSKGAKVLRCQGGTRFRKEAKAAARADIAGPAEDDKKGTKNLKNKIQKN
jgi:hypothetical protein